MIAFFRSLLGSFGPFGPEVDDRQSSSPTAAKFERERWDQRHKVLTAEMDTLARMIDQEYDLERTNAMYVAYGALAWARNPTGYARPSTCLPSRATASTVAPRPTLRVVK